MAAFPFLLLLNAILWIAVIGVAFLFMFVLMAIGYIPATLLNGYIIGVIIYYFVKWIVTSWKTYAKKYPAQKKES